jgi:hypothetical protein
MTLKYDTKNKDPYMDPIIPRYQQLVAFGPQPNQPPGLQPHALPEVIGQAQIIDQTYFPSPIATQQPHAEMSPQYLQMKHLQEEQTLLESSNSNAIAVERLKINQAIELQQNLHRQSSFGFGPQGIDYLNNQSYAQMGKVAVSAQTCAYNAQGEAVSDKSTLYQDRNNKYKHLKEMSPEMLNKMYGRHIDYNVIPESNADQNTSGDIYDQTSCFRTPQNMSMKSHDQLKTQLNKRRQEILSQRSRKGIQSYNNYEYGTNITEAFSSNS